MQLDPFSNHIGPKEDFLEGAADGAHVITSEQYLGRDFWNDLENAKEAFKFRLDGLTPVASIPEGLVNKWLREGFDFWNATANEINRKLRLDGYDGFIISGDKTFDH